MTDQERDALLAIALRAAYVDGDRDAGERARIEEAAARLGGGGVDLAALQREVLGGKRTLEADAARFTTPEARSVAYELAVAVCAADGVTNADEKEFLERLRAALGLDGAVARETVARAEALASVPLETTPVGAGSATPAPAPVAGPGTGAPLQPDSAALDKTILDAAITNGALELLPESLSTMAILPLQMRLVYRVGKAYGYELDRGHITELLATMGVGVASQYVEQVGRKILGGILGAIGGGLLGGLGRQATSSGLTFATTYALGQVAKRYYGSGRTIDTAALKQVFDSMLSEAKGMAGKYTGQMQAKSQTIDVKQLLATVKQG
jgi:uncharacterized protein (DUF697 family)/tellurite resistance protein